MSHAAAPLAALLFDVDGTLAETEEIHRLAFLDAFAEAGLDWDWTVDRYRELLRVTGGKERIRRFLDETGATPSTFSDDRVARLHARKTEHYGRRIAEGRVTLRPGVEALLRRARAEGLRLAIVTTTARPNVAALLEATLAGEGMAFFETMVCGDEVAAKKPAPDAYLAALARLRLPPEACLVFEDSANGLAAARAAGLATIVTPGVYTAHESFAGAARVLADLSAFDLGEWTAAR